MYTNPELTSIVRFILNGEITTFFTWFYVLALNPFMI